MDQLKSFAFPGGDPDKRRGGQQSPSSSPLVAESTFIESPDAVTAGSDKEEIHVNGATSSDSQNNPLNDPPQQQVEMNETESGENFGTQNSAANDALVQPKIFNKGLEIKVNSKTIDVFEYSSFCENISPIFYEKEFVSMDKISGDYICCHQLQEGTRDQLFSRFSSLDSRGIILINSRTDYALAQELVPCVTCELYPVIVISNQDGKKLCSIISSNQDDLTDVFVQVNKTENYSIVEKPSTSQPKKCIESVSKGQRTNSNNLAQQLSNNIRGVISPFGLSAKTSFDQDAYGDIIKSLQQYEKEAKPNEDHGYLKLYFATLKDHVTSCLENCFPFYTILICYMKKRKPQYYDGSELQEFIMTLITETEEASSDKIIRVLQNFFQMGNFKVDEQTLAFSLLQEGCFLMARESAAFLSVKSKPYPKAATVRVYSIMLWTAMAMETNNHMENISPNTSGWNILISSSHQIILDQHGIAEVQKGLIVCDQLELKPDLSCPLNQWKCFLYSKKVRPLQHIRDFILMIKEYMKPVDLFELMKKVKETYAIAEVAELLRIYQDKSITSFLKEGKQFLEQMVQVFSTESSVNELLKDEIEACIFMLLKKIDLKHTECFDQIKVFIKSGENKFSMDYNELIKNSIVTVVQNKFNKLTIREFSLLFKFRIWDKKVIQDFFEKFKIPENISLQEDIWCNFFGAVSERYKKAHAQFLVEFFIRCQEKYVQAKDSLKYIDDLRQIEVDSLLKVYNDSEDSRKAQKTFCQSLQIFITKNNLQYSIQKKMLQYMKEISEDATEFQKLVFEVLCEFSIPSCINSCTVNSTHVVNTMNYVVDIWNTEKNCTQREFCWKILSAFCNKIVVDQENVSGIEIVASTVIKFRLGDVYESSIPNEEFLLAISDDQDVEVNPDIKMYIKWISGVQSVLQAWKKNLEENDFGYENIKNYAHLYVSIKALSDYLSQECVAKKEVVDKAKCDFKTKYKELYNLVIKKSVTSSGKKLCTLLDLLKDYRMTIPANVQIFLSKIFPEEILISPIDIDLDDEDNIKLDISKDVSLKELISGVKELKEFESNFGSYLELLIYFKLNGSVLFDKLLWKSIDRIQEKLGNKKCVSGLSVSQFKEALSETNKFMSNILTSNVTYSEIIGEDKDMIQDLDLDQEFIILRGYDKYSSYSDEGIKGVKCLLELSQYAVHIKIIKNTCAQYETLNHYLNDESMKKLIAIADKYEGDQSTFTAGQAIESMKIIKAELGLHETQSSRCLGIFAAISHSPVFYKFLREKEFYGQQGQANFLQQYELITTQLLHEDYNEQVLNHLRIAFQIMTPFMIAKDKFSQLMKEITKLDYSDGFTQINTVNDHITLIRLWFSKAEGDTIENVANELMDIENTGKFYFVFEEDSQDSIELNKGTLFLQYKISIPNKALTSGADSQHDGEDNFRIERKNIDQINDFVRKLGFLDKDQKGSEYIKCFLHTSEMAYKLLNLYQKLTELAHPRFISKSINIEHIHCSRDISAVDNQVERVKKLLHDWSVEVSKLQKNYHWLLYFNMPKLLQLHKLINSTSRSKQHIDKILLEMEILEWSSSYKTAASKVKDALQQCHDRVDSDSPLNFVGQFLNIVLVNYEVPKYLKFGKMDRFMDQTNICHQPLYYYPNASNEAIIRLLLGLYSEIPKSHSVLHCQTLTSESELKLFMERAKQHHSQYSMIGVNKLPFKLQEQLVEMHINMQQSDYESEERHHSTNISSKVSTIFFVETSPSILHEIPGIDLKDANEVMISCNDAKYLCSDAAQKLACIELVYGSAGDGKTHYIKEKLEECEIQCIIAINEAFNLKNTVSKLRELPYNQQGVCIFFNFSLLPPKENGTKISLIEKKRHQELIEKISWFFFDLLILGYIEDSKSGLSFTMPPKLNWRIYVEVPSRDMKMTAKEALKLFYNDVPALYMIGSEHYIDPNTPYKIDSDVQLVCKYLQAYKLKRNKKKSIDRKYESNYGVIKFSTKTDLTEKECWDLLKEYMPDFIAEKKIMQQLFIRYMKRRCYFLDTLPAYNFNEGKIEYVSSKTGEIVTADYSELGSTLMATMLQEVERFCDPRIKSSKSHQQLIYDFKDGGSSFGLISLTPDGLSEEERKKFKRMKVEIPSPLSMHSREVLDGYLSRALGVPLEERRLAAIDESSYILTLDYTIKMLSIHERHECGIPVIIEGETGVGKTALIQMLSELWNQALHSELKSMKERCISNLKKKLAVVNHKNTIQHCLSSFNITGNEATKEDCHSLCSYNNGNIVWECLKSLRNETIIPLLIQNNKRQYSFEELFVRADELQNSDSTADLLYALLNAKILPLFHKVNVHAGLTPSDIKTQLGPLFKQAYQVHTTYSKILNRSKKSHMSEDTAMNTMRRKLTKGATNIPMESSIEPALSKPYVTVFFDEINTSSCLGLFKEIIIDRMLDGETIPENIFIVAACNPHRGNSMESHGNSMNPLSERWMHGSYHVHSLHPSIEHMKWNYGSLMEDQERSYIDEKMTNVNKDMDSSQTRELSDMIVMSQNSMRKFAIEQLKKHSKGISSEDLKPYSHSCVSQRDIQRVFTFYSWFKTLYEEIGGKPEPEIHRRALYMSLGIVYYMRLNANYREEYKNVLDEMLTSSDNTKFSTIYNEELNFFIEKVNPPSGIARTTALKENILAIIVCTATRTPLIIVGEPGSSKTLSFNLTIGSLKGQESKTGLFRNTEIFKSLDPHIYQGSRRTSSSEIETVFSRAVRRQLSHDQFKLPIYCVVFMDEAGLPEQSKESLKVLHYHLDDTKVAFVAITNNVLDAAKTNRAVSLFRPISSPEDLQALAKGCFSSSTKKILQNELNTIVNFCNPYMQCLRKSKELEFYGLRDFIHFINYLRRKQEDKNKELSAQLVLQALERNFNGSDQFEDVCNKFFGVIDYTADTIHRREVLEVIQESILDQPQPQQDLVENEVRYKLLIDPSEDNSLIHSIFFRGFINRQNTRIYVCSDFPNDGELQKINTIAAIRHSAIEGHTVIMIQTDDIHESFYDLFNQRFRQISTKDGIRYYANIAIGAHLKPSKVDPKFQCIVVVKNFEIKSVPAPFLNRFEKYFISHGNVLKMAIKSLPSCVAGIVEAAKKKVSDFISCIDGKESLYGYQPEEVKFKHGGVNNGRIYRKMIDQETLDSLILSILPAITHKYSTIGREVVIKKSETPFFFMCNKIREVLCKNAGFYMPKWTQELDIDSKQIEKMISTDSSWSTVLSSLTHKSAMIGITEAFNFIFQTTDQIDKKIVMKNTSCLAIAIMEQILIHLMMKRIMQIMTAEAVVINREKIPSICLKYYLSLQNHFSLKDTVMKYHSNYTEKDGLKSPNKLILFSRSTSIIHGLPSQYWGSAAGNFQRHSPKDFKKNLLNLIVEDTKMLVIQKLSSVSSQSSMENLLEAFVKSEDHEIILIIANMHNTSKKIINHIRIMIEDAENYGSNNHVPKLFVLLLHFPPLMFFKHCYPTLFLKGWDHVYLDSIIEKPNKESINIDDWFMQSFFPSLNYNFMEANTDLLFKQTLITAILTRMHFGNKHDESFNSSMATEKRLQVMKNLLESKGVGNLLLKKFSHYWKPQVMLHLLEEFAKKFKEMESTLNMTESIQVTITGLFVNFCVHMLNKSNIDNNLDIIYLEEERCTLIQDLFLKIFEYLPIPNLDDLSQLPKSFPLSQVSRHQCQFPFFSFINSIVEDTIDKSLENLNLVESSPMHKVQVIADATVKNMGKMTEDTEVNILSVVLKDMKTHEEILWNLYFNDFINFKFHLNSLDVGTDHNAPKDIVHSYLHKHFNDLLPNSEISQKLAYLHTYYREFQFQISGMATLLKPLSKIQKLALTSSKERMPLLNSTTETDVKTTAAAEKKLLRTACDNTQSFKTSEQLSEFIITILFDALACSAVPEPTNLESWYKCFSEIMALPTLKRSVYRCSTVIESQIYNWKNLEAKLNIVQAIFIILLSFSTFNQDVSKTREVFQSLLKRCFKENEKDVLVMRPGISMVVDEIIDKLLSKDTKKHVWVAIEGLFNHYFSPYRKDYYHDDVIWFMELANKQNHWIPSSLSVNIKSTQQDEEQTNLQITDVVTRVFPEFIHLNKFKFYLSHILEIKEIKQKPIILKMYREDMLQVMGSILCQSTDKQLEDPGPYIPLFYQSLSLKDFKQHNLVMQKPGCHLYFLTILEHLQSECNDKECISTLVEAAKGFQKQIKQFKPDKAIISWINFQAVIQILLKVLANELKYQIFDRISRCIKDINQILDDCESNGHSAEGHGMVLALNLMKIYKSSRQFEHFIVERKELFSDINCLNLVSQNFKKSSQNKPHIFPFLSSGSEGKLKQLYDNILKELQCILNGKKEVNHLVAIIKKWISKEGTENGKLSFQMVLWLVIYYEFYDKKQDNSPILCDVIKSNLSEFITDESYVHILVCFLDPTNMIKNEQPPSPQVHYTGIIGEHRKRTDPLFELFNSRNKRDNDQSHADLRHALANLVAVVLGTSSKSNHLWYHMCSPQKLENTYITGFMYNNKIERGGLQYDCGVELTSYGQYARKDYSQHACRGTYNLHSLYLLLWANFGAFCMSLLTQPNADEELSSIISDHLSLRHYCISQVKTLWMHIQNNITTTEEIRSLLITQVLYNFYKVQCEPQTERFSALLETTDQLDCYELMWHRDICRPAGDSLSMKYQELCKEESGSLNELRKIDTWYPHFPSEQEFVQCILNIDNIHQSSEHGRLHFLSKFAMEWPRLKIAGLLLPDLVEFYLWLHLSLAHQITRREAESIPIIEYIGENYKQLFMRMKTNFNKYLESVKDVTGAKPCIALHHGISISEITDETTLIHFLSDEDQEGKDWLFIVASDIIHSHNQIIENVYSSSQVHPLTCQFPEPSKILPTEVNKNIAIIGDFEMLHGLSPILQLIRSRYLPALASKEAQGTPQTDDDQVQLYSKSEVFLLEKLEDDIIEEFLAGKPLIMLEKLRTPFKFKEVKNIASSSVSCTKLDLKEIDKQLPEEFKRNLSPELLKKLEYDFQSASFQQLNDVIMALMTVTKQLIKAHCKELKEDCGCLEKLSLSQFMRRSLGMNKDRQVFTEIGILNIEDEQQLCIAELPLKNTYNCLILFFTWVDEGFYDFQSVPFIFKSHMTEDNKKFLECKLQSQWKGTTNDLIEEIEHLIKVLKDSEKDIINRVEDASTMSIKQYLQESELFDRENDRIFECIPKTIMLQHYVEVRLSLRKIFLQLKDEMDQSHSKKQAEKKELNYQTDLWTTYLPNIEKVMDTQIHQNNESDVVVKSKSLESESSLEPDAISKDGDKWEQNQSKAEESSIPGSTLPSKQLAKRKKLDKHELEDWLKGEGIEAEDIEYLKSKGVAELHFLNIKPNKKHYSNLSESTTDILPVLQEMLRHLLAFSAKRKKHNKKELADWLKEQGIETEDIEYLQSKGVAELHFLNIKPGSKHYSNLSEPTTDILPTLQEMLEDLK